MSPRRHARRGGEAGAASGFSLPEVTLALGLLAGALISLCGVFVMAERLVHGGKTHTQALSIARDILEETDAWHFEGLYEHFGFDGAASRYVVDTRSNPRGAAWQAALDRDLASAHAEIVVESIDDGGSPPALRDARYVRVSVTVFWRDEARERQVSLATVRS